MKNYKTTLVIFSFAIGFTTFSCSTDDSSLIDGLPEAVINTDPNDAPPRGLDESWNGHSEQLYRQYYNNHLAVYYDDAVERPLEWPYAIFSDVWADIKESYGYGSDNRLYAVFHGDGDAKPYAGTIFSEETSNRNLIDIRLDGMEQSSGNLDLAFEQLGQVVESSAFGINGSPASSIWKDKWKEIFLYDMYVGTERTDEADRIYNTYSEVSADFPNPDTYWFGDWFFPIYDSYGGRAALSRFFRTTADNYAIEGDGYAHEMNIGEFIHFFSGAVGEDLQPLAEEAFGWSNDFDTELRQARATYPNLDYPFEPTSEIIDLTLDAVVTVNRDNNGGPDAAEGSTKVIDNDVNTKFLINPYVNDLYIQLELSEPKVVNKYSLSSANDAAGRDPKAWVIAGSMDGVNWVELDSREGESFSSRFLTKEYNIDNEEAYKFYRMSVTENNGDGLFQLAEWRLKVLQLIDPAQ